MKILLKIIAILALLVILLVAGLVLIINTGDYKSTIETAVAEATGYQLTIAGDLDLQFFPNLGLTLNDVRLSNPNVRQELASTSAVVLRVNAAQLIQGQLMVQQLFADDFHVNYYIDPDGNSIWDVAGPNDEIEPAADDTTSFATNDVNISFERISIENTSIDFQDMSQGVRYQVADLNLESRDTNINGRPFELDINFDFENNGMSEAVPMALRSTIIADLQTGNIALSDINFSVTPLLLQGEMNLINFNQNLQFSGNFRSNDFDLKGLMQTLGMIEVNEALLTPDLNQQQLASLAVEFSGNQTEATVPNLTVSLGDAAIEADASIRFGNDLAPMNVSYRVNGGAIDLTPFMSSEEEAVTEEQAADPVASNPATATPASELPTELLTSMNLLGSIAIESVRAGDFLFEDINVFTNVEDGVLDVEVTPVTAFEGSLQGALRLDARSTSPALNSQVTVNRINLVELAPSVSRFNTVTGFLNVEAAHTATGNTTQQLMNSLSGSTNFSIEENSVDIGVIKQVFTAIAALSPTGEAIQQWPDVIQFSELGGSIVLEDGIDENQQLVLRMDNFDVSGSGGIDLDAETFDYKLAFTLLGPPERQTIPINELYHNVQWPVECSAAFSDEVSQYCGPDFARVREIFTQIGANAVRNRLEEELNDQLPDDVQDAARGLLRNILN